MSEVIVRVGEKQYRVAREVDSIKRVARENNIAVFDLYDTDGNIVFPEDLEKLSDGSTLEIRAYNAPK